MNMVDQLETRTSRRAVVRTGARLGYAVPIVAASFKLTAAGSLAADPCLPGYILVDLPTEQQCCKCDGVLADYTPVVEGGKAVCKDIDFSVDAVCVGVLPVSPI